MSQPVQSSYDDGASPRGYVRLLIADTATSEAEQIFTDGELESLLAGEGSPLLAAAAALDIIATTEALLSKKITTQDLSTDGPAVAKALQDQAKSLRDRAKGQELAITEEWAFHPFTLSDTRGPEATERAWWL